MADVQRTPSIRFFLSKAFAPNVQANNRWIGVHASNRRAFAIAGKDRGTPFLGWLASGRPEVGAEFEAAALQLGLHEMIEGDGYLDWYRDVNYDYPFLDYSAADARETDDELMDTYASASSPPPWTTERSGRRVCLSDEGVACSGVAFALEPSERLLGAWLRTFAGYNASSQGRMGRRYHRTSPSGGARHPTDLGVSLGDAWGDLAGSWWYDPIEHELVSDDVPVIKGASGSTRRAVVTVTSHVERAMWRYRDVRAFRPVLYDAGHVVETIMLTAQATGWSATWIPRGSFLSLPGSAFDAVLGFVVLDSETVHAEFPLDRLPPREPVAPPFRTNPFLSLEPRADSLVAHSHLGGVELPVTGAMVDVLAWATPSARRDRPTDPDSLAASSGARPHELAALVHAGLLLSEEEGDRLWDGIRPWSAHDWFLSALLHAEAGAAPAAMRRHEALDDGFARRLPVALDRRRTSRQLFGAELPECRGAGLLRALQAQEHVLAVLSSSFVLAGLPPGVHQVLDGRITRLAEEAISEEAVTRAAIGQPWARGFSCVCWLVPQPVAGGAAGWEAQVIDCGRLAQRIALEVADDPAIGVFQSPAMIDTQLEALLPGHSVRDGAYLVGFGITKPTTDIRVPSFRIQDLLRPVAL
jgi:hypothetical protein